MKLRPVLAGMLTFLVGAVVGTWLRGEAPADQVMAARPTATPIFKDTAPIQTRAAELEAENRKLRDEINSMESKMKKAAAASKVGRVSAAQLSIQALKYRTWGQPWVLTDEMVDYLGLNAGQRAAIESIVNSSYQTFLQQQKASSVITKLDPNKMEIRIPVLKDVYDLLAKQRDSSIIAMLGPNDGAVLNEKIAGDEADDHPGWAVDLIVTRGVRSDGFSGFEYYYYSAEAGDPVHPTKSVGSQSMITTMPELMRPNLDGLLLALPADWKVESRVLTPMSPSK